MLFRSSFDQGNTGWGVLEAWQGPSQESIDACKEGPDNEWYWDAWQGVLDNATWTKDGYTWRLHQDGDLWAVCDDLMDDEEFENFYGEPRE